MVHIKLLYFLFLPLLHNVVVEKGWGGNSKELLAMVSDPKISKIFGQRNQVSDPLAVLR